MVDFKQAIAETLERSNDNESHKELDKHTFHPSQLTLCERQCVASKLGIKVPNTKLLGIFQIGTLVHGYLENNLELDHVVQRERSLRFSYPTDQMGFTPEKITITGSTDLYIPATGTVVDYKTQNGWYYHDPENEGAKDDHIQQIHTYADMLQKSGMNVNELKIVYINKGDMEVKPVTLEYDTPKQDHSSYMWDALHKAVDISAFLRNNGFPQSESELPPKCGCYVCENEGELDFSHL